MVIIDVHTHLSSDEQWGPVFQAAIERTYEQGAVKTHVTPERHWAAAQGADRVIVFGINSLAEQMHTPNDAIAEYVRAHPEKLIGFMSIDPNQPDALEELERCVADLGLRGIKMSPVYQHFHPSGPLAERIHARAEELGLPIMTHLALSPLPNAPLEWGNPLIYDPVARQFPKLKIIVPHMGRPWFHDAMVLARKHPNVYADVSGATACRWWGYQALAAFYEFGVMDKLLFGSDFPFVTVERQAHELRNINDVVAGTGLPRIPEDQIEAIIQRDSLALLGLAQRAG